MRGWKTTGDGRTPGSDPCRPWPEALCRRRRRGSRPPARIGSRAARGAGPFFLGRSPAFRRMLALVLRVAAREVPVLLVGEPGVGKSRLALAIHRLGRQAQHPFVSRSCAETSRPLFEGEKLPGRGTLYLDGVDDLSPSRQGELLRWLARPGRRRDLRLIFSAGLDLDDRVERGTFSPDLYYRISVFPIRVPALRERREDLEWIARKLLEQIEPGMELDPRTCAALAEYPFPGNLDELRTMLEHACLESEGSTILPCHLPDRRGS